MPLSRVDWSFADKLLKAIELSGAGGAPAP
jgi:hypothetical protein